MIIILLIYLVTVLLWLNLLRGVVRTSAGFLRLALMGVRVYYWYTIPMAEFAVTRERRIANGIAAVVFPVVCTAVTTLAIVWLASLMAMVV